MQLIHHILMILLRSKVYRRRVIYGWGILCMNVGDGKHAYANKA
jgi:hypothetical protein